MLVPASKITSFTLAKAKFFVLKVNGHTKYDSKRI